MQFKCLEAVGETGVVDVVQTNLLEVVKIHSAHTLSEFAILNVSSWTFWILNFDLLSIEPEI